MGVDSYQPLVEGKGDRREAESERSLRQSSELRNTNNIRHILTENKTKSYLMRGCFKSLSPYFFTFLTKPSILFFADSKKRNLCIADDSPPSCQICNLAVASMSI